MEKTELNAHGTSVAESSISSMEDEVLGAHSRPCPARDENKAIFESAILDDFLANHAKLNISYELPMLEAVKSITNHDSEDETDTLCPDDHGVDVFEGHTAQMKRSRISAKEITVNHGTLSWKKHSDCGPKNSFTSSATASGQILPHLQSLKVCNLDKEKVDSESEDAENCCVRTYQRRLGCQGDRLSSRKIYKLTNSDMKCCSSLWSRPSDGDRQLHNTGRKQGNDCMQPKPATVAKKTGKQCGKTENSKHTLILKKGFEGSSRAAAVKADMVTQSKSVPRNQPEMKTETKVHTSHQVRPKGKSCNVLHDLEQPGVSVIGMEKESNSVTKSNIGIESPGGHPNCQSAAGVLPVISTSPGHSRLLSTDVFKRVKADFPLAKEEPGFQQRVISKPDQANKMRKRKPGRCSDSLLLSACSSPKITKLAGSGKDRVKSAIPSSCEKEKHPAQPSPPQLQQLSLQQSRLSFPQPQPSTSTRAVTYAKNEEIAVSLDTDDKDLEDSTELNKNIEKLCQRYECFVVINKVNDCRGYPYCIEHDQYYCERTRQSERDGLLVQPVHINTALSDHSPSLKPHGRHELVLPPTCQVAVKTPSRTHEARSWRNVEKHSARTAGFAAKYLKKQINKDASGGKGDADGSNGIQAVAVTNLNHEDSFEQKQQDQEQQQQGHQSLPIQGLDCQLGSYLHSLPSGSRDSSTQAFADANILPDLSLLPKGQTQVVSVGLLKNLFSENEIFVWMCKVDNTSKVLITNSSEKPYPLFFNLKSMQRLQDLPLFMRTLMIAEEEAAENIQKCYAVLSCDGQCWEITGTLTGIHKNITQKSITTKDGTQKAMCIQTSQNHATFAELRNSEDATSFSTRVLASLSRCTGGDMLFELAHNVNVHDESANVMAGDYVLPPGASMFCWFSVPLVKRYDIVYIESKHCYIEYDEMEGMVLKALQSKMALCKPLLERREGYASVRKLTFLKFGVYADFSVPEKLLFGPFTKNEKPCISLHHFIELPQKKYVVTGVNADSKSSDVHLPSINSSSHLMKQLQASSRCVSCVLQPTMSGFGYIDAVHNSNGTISFQHPLIKEKKLTFTDVAAINAWLNRFLQSRILYVPRQLSVKWKCIPLDYFDSTAEKPFDYHVLNGNYVMTVVGVFNVKDIPKNQAASYGLKKSLLHKIKQKLRRRDVINGFKNLARVLNSESNSKRLPKQKLLYQALYKIRKLEAKSKTLSHEKNQLQLEKQRLLSSLYHHVKSLSDEQEIRNIEEELNKILEMRDSIPVIHISESEDEADQISSLNPAFGSFSKKINPNANNQKMVIDISSSDSDIADYLSEDEQSIAAENGAENIENGSGGIGMSKKNMFKIKENESEIQLTDETLPKELNVDSDCDVTIERTPSDFRRATSESFFHLKNKPAAKVVLPANKVIEVIEISDEDDSDENVTSPGKQSSDVTSGYEKLLSNIKQ